MFFLLKNGFCVIKIMKYLVVFIRTVRKSWALAQGSIFEKNMERNHMGRILNSNTLKTILTLLFLLSFNSYANGSDIKECKSLDTREFGLVGDGTIGAPWSEAQLIEKYGPPCQIINLGAVFTKRSFGKIIEIGPKDSEHDKITFGEISEKKQFIYTRDYSNKTSIITIVGGVVVKKERIYD